MHKRNLLKLSASGLALGALAPSKWSAPILKLIVLPAHAQTSMCVGEFSALGQNFILDAEGGRGGSLAYQPTEFIDFSNFGTLNGDLVVNFNLGASSLTNLLQYRAVRGSGDAFLDYAYTCNGVELGTFRLTILNLSA